MGACKVNPPLKIIDGVGGKNAVGCNGNLVKQSLYGVDLANFVPHGGLKHILYEYLHLATCILGRQFNRVVNVAWAVFHLGSRQSKLLDSSKEERVNLVCTFGAAPRA